MVFQLPLGNSTICFYSEKLANTRVFSSAFCLRKPNTFGFLKSKGTSLPPARLFLVFLRLMTDLYRFKKDFLSSSSEATFLSLNFFSRGSQGSTLEKPPNLDAFHCIGVRSGSR